MRSQSTPLLPAVKILTLAFLGLVIPANSEAQGFRLEEYVIPGPPEFASDMTVGPDGAVWFTDGSYPRIGRITTAGVITLYQVRPFSEFFCGNCGLYGIATGPDGALWFADPYGRQIGRITTAGMVTWFSLQPMIPWVASMDFSPAMAAGPDGAMWFTWSPAGNYDQPNPYGIGRITMAGQVSWYPTSGPTHGIVAGSDGALWFTEPYLSKPRVGRITTAGVLTEYPVSNGPERITTGPDGALWFTTTRGIGRISTAGDLSEYPGPWGSSTAFVCSDAIVTGPDGNLWFTRYYEQTVGRVTPAGVFTTPIVSGIKGHPLALVLGPDDSLWMGERQEMGLPDSNPGVIGRITLTTLDSTAPVIVAQLSGVLSGNGWYSSNVTITWAVHDPESLITTSSGCAPTILTAETAGQRATCSATNGAGLTTSVPVTVKIDKTPPSISGMPGPRCTLWPPNHKLVQVGTVSAADLLSGLAPSSLLVTGASNEPDDANDPAIVITRNVAGGFDIQLRAERLASGAGKVYSLTAVARDLAGNTATVTTTCTVPHDQGN